MTLLSCTNTPKLSQTPGKVSKRSDSAVEVVQNSMVDFLDAPGQAAYYKQKFTQLAKLRETDVEKELCLFKDIAQERIDLLEAKLEQLEGRCRESGVDVETTAKIVVSKTPTKGGVQAGSEAETEASAGKVDAETEKELDDQYCKLVFYERLTGVAVDEIKDDVVECTFNENSKFSLTFVEEDKVEYRMKKDDKDMLPGFLKNDIKFSADSLPKILGNIYFK